MRISRNMTNEDAVKATKSDPLTLSICGVLFLLPTPVEGMMWLRPVAATRNVICTPGEGACYENEIILSGGDVTVTLFIELAGWDPDQYGDPLLGAYQGTVDSRTFRGIGGIDLVPVGAPDMGFEGAFQALKVCAADRFDPQGTSNLLSRCEADSDCPTETPFCVDRWDYAFYQLDNTPTVSTATADYSWSSASIDCREDPDGETWFYGGTLLLQVPDEARGVYTVELSDHTLISGCAGGAALFARLHAKINVMPGATDCNGNGIPDEYELESADCNNNEIPDDCEPDGDGDGTIDACDGCPNDPNKIEPGPCGCGVDDDADSDGDGIADCYDECPGVDDRIFAPDCIDKIPTMSTWGLVITALLLLSAGKIFFGRPRTCAPDA